MSKKQSSTPHDALFKLFFTPTGDGTRFSCVSFTGTHSRAL